MNEVDDFVLRCQMAGLDLHHIMERDPSCRVWMAVFCEEILDMVKKQENVAGAAEQLLTMLESRINKILAVDRLSGN